MTREGIEELKERIARLTRTPSQDKRLVGDLLTPGDLVVLVTPIDSAAPKGRLILPQQQTIRDVLDADCTAIVVKENTLAPTLEKLAVKPAWSSPTARPLPRWTGTPKGHPPDLLLHFDGPL